MHVVNNILKFWSVSKALNKKAPHTVTTSFPRNMKNDFYWIHLILPELEMFVEKEEEGILKGVAYVKSQEEGGEFWIKKQSLKKKRFSIEITHHYKQFTIVFKSAYEFLFFYIFKAHRLLFWKDSAAQKLYNRKTPVRQKRIDILRIILKRDLSNPGQRFSATSLALSMKSERWIRHPKRKEDQRYLELILESLESSKDLQKQNGLYQISKNAIATISEYERDDQKHRDLNNNGICMIILTLALVITGIFNSEYFLSVIELIKEDTMNFIDEKK